MRFIARGEVAIVTGVVLSRTAPAAKADAAASPEALRHSRFTDVRSWVVSHASRLIATLKEDPDCNAIELDKVLGEAVIRTAGSLEEPNWKWPER